MDTTALVERLQQGEEHAAEDLCRLVSYCCGAFAKRKAPNDVDDVLQEVTLKVLIAVRAGLMRDPRKLSTFITVTCQRYLIDRWRRAPKIIEVPETEAHQVRDLSPDPEQRQVNAEKLRLAEQLLVSIPAAPRSAFLRFYIEEQTVARIASEMNAPTGTVKTWLQRTRRQLRAA